GNDERVPCPGPFAVLLLMTSWKFVGCSIGRSAGHAPFRILSTIPRSGHLPRMLASGCNRPPPATAPRNELPFDHLIYRRTGNLRAVELMLGHTRIEVRLATSASRSMMPSILQRRSRSELPGQSCRALLAGGYGQKVPNQIRSGLNPTRLPGSY